MIKKIYILILPLLFLFQACGIYSFSGASIPDDMKTVTVEFFENNAPMVVPYLSQQFTEALKERIRNQSRLSIVRSGADAIFEGRITDYSIAPSAVTGQERAELNRLTITVNVKYTNNLKPDLSFEQSFSRYVEFKGSIQTQESQLIPEVNRMLTEDIFNRAFANW